MENNATLTDQDRALRRAVITACTIEQPKRGLSSHHRLWGQFAHGNAVNSSILYALREGVR